MYSLDSESVMREILKEELSKELWEKYENN